MKNDPTQELRYILWVLETTRTVEGLASAQRVKEILGKEGYSVELQTVEAVRNNLQITIKSPWMIDERLGFQGTTTAAKSYKLVATRIKENKSVPKPTAPLLQRIYTDLVPSKVVTRSKWESVIRGFIANPFWYDQKTAKNVGAINAALSPGDYKHDTRAILRVIEASPELRAQLKEAIQARNRFTKVRRYFQDNRVEIMSFLIGKQRSVETFKKLREKRRKTVGILASIKKAYQRKRHP